MGNTCGCINRNDEYPGIDQPTRSVANFMSTFIQETQTVSSLQVPIGFSPQKSMRCLSKSEMSYIRRTSELSPSKVEMLMNLFPNLSFGQLLAAIPISLPMLEPLSLNEKYIEAVSLGGQACALLSASLDCDTIPVESVWNEENNLAISLWGNLQSNHNDLVCWSLVAIESIFSFAVENAIRLSKNEFDMRPLVRLLEHSNEFVRFWCFKAIVTVLNATGKTYYTLHEDYILVFMLFIRNLSMFDHLALTAEYIALLSKFIDEINKEDVEKLENYFIQSISKTIQKSKSVDKSKRQNVKEIILDLTKLKEKVREYIIKIYYSEKRVFKEEKSFISYLELNEMVEDLDNTQSNNNLNLGLKLRGSNSLCSLIHLLEQYPRSNHEVYLITQTQTLPKLINNFSQEDEEILHFTLILMSKIIKNRVISHIPVDILTQITSALCNLINSKMAYERFYAIKILCALYQRNPNGLPSSVIVDIFLILADFRDPETLCKSLKYLILLLINTENEPNKEFVAAISNHNAFETLIKIQAAFNDMSDNHQFVMYKNKFVSIYSFLAQAVLNK